MSGLSSSPVGGGIFFTIASRISFVPMPSLALASIASEQSSPIASSICSFVFSGSAAGRSILFITGIISRSCSTARYALARVCASTPCDASTIRSAPSHEARLLDTSYEKSTCPGVSMRLRMYSFPSSALYKSLTECALIVMPLSLSRSIESRTCSVISLALSAPVNSRSLSARVDFPWSI